MPRSVPPMQVSGEFAGAVCTARRVQSLLSKMSLVSRVPSSADAEGGLVVVSCGPLQLKQDQKAYRQVTPRPDQSLPSFVVGA
jgi:hypothetical protein